MSKRYVSFYIATILVKWTSCKYSTSHYFIVMFFLMFDFTYKISKIKLAHPVSKYNLSGVTFLFLLTQDLVWKILFCGFLALKSIGIKYLVWRGGEIGSVSVLTSLLVKSFFYYYFELKPFLFFMTKAILNKDSCFIKAVLLLCAPGQCLLNFASHGLSVSPPPHHQYY